MKKTFVLVLAGMLPAILASISPASSCVECASGKTAVIVVDVQGDFTTWKGGAAALPGTDEAYVKGVGKATADLSRGGAIVFGTQDWHPADHISFFTRHENKKPHDVVEIGGRAQLLYPPHCVQGTENARVLVDNNLFLAIVRKGEDPRYEGCSGFRNCGGGGTEMEKVLRRNMVTKVVVYGIGTDSVVMETALDAAKAGYKTVVIENLCRGRTPEATGRALKILRDKGIVTLKNLDLKKIHDL